MALDMDTVAAMAMVTLILALLEHRVLGMGDIIVGTPRKYTSLHENFSFSSISILGSCFNSWIGLAFLLYYMF